MPRLFFAVPARVKLVMLMLMLLPCVPGLIFVLAGWARDPLWPGQDMTPAMWTEHQRAAQQSHGLYRAGAAALGMGALCGVAIAWRVVRHCEEPDEDTDERLD